MTISAYTGLPGHGKSYGVVENVIVPACKEMRVVFCNIPLNTNLFLERFGIAPIYFSIDEIRNNPTWFSSVFEAGALFVIDECWRLWPAGTNANKLSEDHKAFFAEHRHLVGEDGRSTEIVLVTQDLAQIASFMRSLVETTFRVTKLSKVGASKLYRVDVYSGAVTGAKPPEGRREREIPGKFKKEIYALYKSHTKSSNGAGDESRADGRFNVFGGFKVKIFFITLIFILVLIWLGSDSLLSSFGVKKSASSPEVVSSLTAPSASVAPVAPVVSHDFIESADRIFISYNNVVRSEGSSTYDFLFRVVFSDSYSDLSFSDLNRLGYKMTYINNCLVKIEINSSVHYALCEGMHDDRSNLITDLTNQKSASI